MVYVSQQLDDGSFRIVGSDSSVVFQTAADSKSVATKVATVARTNTTAKNLFKLPANAVPVGLRIISGTASNAGTSGVVSVGKTGSNTFFLNGQDVVGVSGQIPCAAAANLGSSVGSSEIQVVGLYAETGTASTTGGPFTVVMEYYLP